MMSNGTWLAFASAWLSFTMYVYVIPFAPNLSV
jgi:hypothetical protein